MTTAAHRRYYSFVHEQRKQAQVHKTVALEEIPESPAADIEFPEQYIPTIYEWLMGRRLPDPQEIP